MSLVLDLCKHSLCLCVWCMSLRGDQIIREHILLSGSTPAVLHAIIPALCETGKWRRPNLRLQHPLHWGGSSWHKLEFLLYVFFSAALQSFDGYPGVFFPPDSSFDEIVSPGGSFRHFLWQVCKELQSSALSLLLPCPSAAANRNKVRIVSI